MVRHPLAAVLTSLVLLSVDLVYGVELGARQEQRPLQLHDEYQTRRRAAHDIIGIGAHHHALDRRQSNATNSGNGISLTGINDGISFTSHSVEPPPSSTTSVNPPTSATLPTSSLPVTTSSTPSLPPPVQSSQTSSITASSTTSSTSSAPSSSSSSSTSTSSTTSTTSSAPTARPLGPSTIIITTTLENGSVLTSASMATQSAGASEDSSGSNSKAWIIPLSVVGGIVALAGILFVGYRCTQQRFSELDDDDGRGIRWPELLKRNEEEITTLNPLSTKRREGGAGFDMDETKSIMSHRADSPSEGLIGATTANHVGSDIMINNTEHFAAAGLGVPGRTMMSRQPSSAGSSSSHLGNGAAYYASPQPGYYDPHLGLSAAPYPPPRALSPQPPNAYYDANAYGQASNYYPPPLSRAASLSPKIGGRGQMMGSASPDLTITASEPYGHQHSNSSASELMTMTRPLSPSVVHDHANLRPHLTESQPNFRLSIANPDGDDR